ncbi:MAG: tetratricopeptide repeat protein, partial [Acidobacteria bacterium]|nr:tetratricopeptide repeat protein [Acidobacteriota bacterium]
MRRAVAFTALVMTALLTTSVSSQERPGDIDAAISFWESRVARDPDDHIAPTRLGAAYLAKARQTGDFRLYHKAEAAFEEAVRRAPSHYSALSQLAAAQAARHRFRDAIELASKAVALEPAEPYAYTVLGDAQLAVGDLTQAEATYTKLAELAPGHLIDTRLANFRHDRGDTRGAMTLLERALADAVARQAPGSVTSWCHVRMGSMAFDSGDWNTAERQYTAALEISPDSFAALEHLAELRAAQGRTAEALTLYDRTLAIAPLPEFMEAVAGIHQKVGNTAEAARWHTRALAGYREAVDAGDIGYYRPLALFYADVRQEHAEAVAWARKDLTVRQDALTWGTLAWVLYRSGDYQEARDAARKATASGTADAKIWFTSGMVALGLKDRKKAAADLRHALELNPRFDKAAEARDTLRTLSKTR